MVESRKIPDQIAERRQVVNLNKDGRGLFVTQERTLTHLPKYVGVYELPSQVGSLTVDMSLQKIRPDQAQSERHVIIEGKGIGKNAVHVPVNWNGDGETAIGENRQIVVYTRDITSNLRIAFPSSRPRGW